MSVTSQRALALLSLALFGCSDNGTGPIPTISVSVTPAALSIPAGASGEADITIARAGGFTGAVSLTLAGAPAGVTAGFTPTIIGSGTTTSTLTLGIGPGVPPGTHSLTVRASGTGVSDATAALSLTVTVPPSFTIAVNPAALNITQGNAQVTTVSLTRDGGFAGAVALALEGAPAGMTGAFAPNPAPANTSTLTVTVGPAVPAGPYNLTVRGTAAGLPDRTATLTVTVLAPAGGFTLALNPATLTITQGQADQTTVSITRTGGFAGDVTLALEGAPAGVTGAFVPNPAGGAVSVLTVTVGAATAPGDYQLTVRGSTPAASAGGLRTSPQFAADQVVQLALTVNVAGGYTLSATAVSIAQGGSGNSTVTITRVGGNTSPISLSLEGTPAGVTGNFTPNPATGGTSTLALTVGALVPPGGYNLTVRGATAGLADQTAGLLLTVTAGGGFTLSADPATLSLTPGGNTSTTITVARTGGFAESVAFSYTTTAPAGVTITFVPAATTGTTTSMGVTVGNGVAVGVYTITVRGTATGLAEQTTIVTLNVIAPGGGNVTWTFCDQTGIPVWLAVQDGAVGGWTQVVGVAGSFNFNVTQPTGAVAWVIMDGPRADLSVLYGSLSELLNGGPGCTGTGVLKTVNGVMANLEPGQTATVSIGGATSNVTTVTPGYPNFSLDGVADGVTDLFATNWTPGLPATINAFIIRRGLNPPDGSTIPGVLDWTGVDRVTPVQRAITLTNSAGPTTTLAAYLTAGGTVGSLYSLLVAGPSYYGVPASAQQPGDLHLLTVLESGTPSAYRSLTKVFELATDQVLTYGGAPPAATFSWAATVPYVRPRTQFTNLAEYGRLVVLSWANTGGNLNNATVTIWEGYGLGLPIDYTLPDFSAVAGWNNAWGLQPGTGAPINATYLVTGWVAGGGPAEPPLADGTIQVAAGRTASINP